MGGGLPEVGLALHASRMAQSHLIEALSAMNVCSDRAAVSVLPVVAQFWRSAKK